MFGRKSISYAQQPEQSPNPGYAAALTRRLQKEQGVTVPMGVLLLVLSFAKVWPCMH